MRFLVQCFLATALACLCACKAHGPSGAYLERGGNFVEVLQVTAGNDGGFEGTLTRTQLEADGTLSQQRIPIRGVVDGNAITISLKRPPPSPPMPDSSGTFEGGVITLSLQGHSARYAASKPEACRAALQAMQARGLAIRDRLRAKREKEEQQERMRAENAKVVSANKRLDAFAVDIREPRYEQMLEIFHATHAHALKSARSALRSQKEFPPRSPQANQIGADIDDIEAGLATYDRQWEAHSGTLRARLQALDRIVSTSPCRSRNLHMPLPACRAQPEAVRAYQAGKAIAIRQAGDIDATLEADRAAIQAIAKESDGYREQR